MVEAISVLVIIPTVSWLMRAMYKLEGQMECQDCCECKNE